jgi:Sigma-70 region 2
MGYVGQGGAPSPVSVATPTRSASQAIPILYGSHYPHLVRLAVLLLGDPGRAEEIVQDAFVDLVQRWPRLRDQRAAVSYLRTSVANGPASHRRRAAAPGRPSLGQGQRRIRRDGPCGTGEDHDRPLDAACGDLGARPVSGGGSRIQSLQTGHHGRDRLHRRGLARPRRHARSAAGTMKPHL